MTVRQREPCHPPSDPLPPSLFAVQVRKVWLPALHRLLSPAPSLHVLAVCLSFCTVSVFCLTTSVSFASLLFSLFFCLFFPLFFSLFFCFFFPVFFSLSSSVSSSLSSSVSSSQSSFLLFVNCFSCFLSFSPPRLHCLFCQLLLLLILYDCLLNAVMTSCAVDTVCLCV